VYSNEERSFVKRERVGMVKIEEERKLEEFEREMQGLQEPGGVGEERLMTRKG